MSSSSPNEEAPDEDEETEQTVEAEPPTPDEETRSEPIDATEEDPSDEDPAEATDPASAADADDPGTGPPGPSEGPDGDPTEAVEEAPSEPGGQDEEPIDALEQATEGPARSTEATEDPPPASAEPTEPPEAAIEELGDEIDPQEAELVELDEGDVASFHEPVEEGSSASAPATPTGESLALVEDVVPDEIGEMEGEGSPRRALDDDQLADLLAVELEEPITPVPPLEAAHLDTVDLRTIRDGVTYVRTVFDERANRYLYQVIEPPLNDDQYEHLTFLRETLVQTLEVRDEEADVDWQQHLHEAVEDAIAEHGLDIGGTERARLHYYLERDLLGYAAIDVPMQDPMVEDISCDGPGIPIYIFHRDHESVRSNIVVDDEDELDGFVRTLAQRAGRHISIADPMLDGTLPDTSRLQATLSREVTTRGSSFTIRRYRADPLTIADLVRTGTISARMAAWAWMAIEAGAPLLVAGGTASGKTTTLSSILQFVPPARKIVTIEDTREFSLVHENWVASLTRSGGSGEDRDRDIDMYELLRTALRQRPEYLVVGEVRGSEAQTLFQAMATGHATYSTMHADSTKSAVYRLENPPIDIPRMMLQTLDAIMVQTQTRVDGKTVRRVQEVTEIVGVDEQTDDVLTNRVYSWKADDDTFRFHGRSNILERVRQHRNATVAEIETDWARRTELLSWMVDEGLRHIRDVAQIVAAYHADPERVMDRIGETVDEGDDRDGPPATGGSSA